jgi:PAS domain S-box-containing protein
MRLGHGYQSNSALGGIWKLFSALTFVVCFASRTLAAPVQEVTQVGLDRASISLSNTAYVLRDPSQAIQLAELVVPGASERFQPGNLDVGSQHAAFWVRVRLHNIEQNPTVWWLDTGNHYLPELSVFSVDGSGRFLQQSAGANRAFHDRPLSTPNFVYPVALPAGKTVDVFVRASTRGILSHTLDLKLWQPDAYRAYIRHVEVQWFLFLGISLGLALFNLFLYFSLRDSNYLIYVSTVVAQVWRTSDNGIAYEYFWPDFPFFEQVLSRGLSMIAVVAVTHLFVFRFMELHLQRPVLYRRLNFVQFAIAVLILFAMSSVYTSSVVPLPLFGIAQLLFVLGIVCYVVVALFILANSAWRGNRRARSLLVAFSPLLILTGVVVPLLGLLKIDVNWTIPPMMLGAAIEMILMSLALADRLNEATQGKEQAQRALVVGLQRKERELELRVEQRTQDLAHANEAFQGILENAQDAVVITHHRGQITHWNRQSELTFGWSREHALGRDFSALVFPHHQVPAQVTYMLTQDHHMAWREAPRIETVALRQDGTEFPVELSATAIKVDDQVEFSFFLRDITQRRQADAEIRASLARQRELVELKSRFVTMASHEFRTPLTTIFSSTELLRFYSDRLPPVERDGLYQAVENSVQRMTQMLDDLLLIGKSDAGMLEYQPAWIDLLGFCESLVKEIGAGLSEVSGRDQVIALHVAPAIGSARLDPKLMRHIFLNLLSNALKYSPNGAQVDFEVDVRGDNIEFMVADQGIGIPEADIASVFDPFSRASNVGDIAGTGLGLSIVKRAVELQGGTLAVKSTLGVGSRFFVNLPIDHAGQPGEA